MSVGGNSRYYVAGPLADQLQENANGRKDQLSADVLE